MPFRNVTYPVHHFEHEGSKVLDEIEVEVFGSGFMHFKHSRTDDTKPIDERYKHISMIIDPEDIEKLEVALKEAKRRRRYHIRRVRKKIALERAASGNRTT